MTHVWQHQHGKPSSRGYHNREWAAKMKAIGLQPSNTGAACAAGLNAEAAKAAKALDAAVPEMHHDDAASTRTEGFEAGAPLALSKVQSVDQRMRLECDVGFANCGRAVVHVRGSYVPQAAVSNRSKPTLYSITSSARASSVGGPARQELLDLIEECAATALPPHAVLARKLDAALL